MKNFINIKDISFKVLRSIWEPIQNNPVNIQTLLIFFSKLLISSEGLKKELRKTARMKNIINRGKPKAELFSLKYQAENKISGTIHKVLPNFKVAATSKASSPIIEEAPITEAVSCIARAAQEPNCSWFKSIQFPNKGKITTAMAFKTKIIVKDINNSFGFGFIMGATAAIAEPPHIAEPDAIR